VLLCYLVMLCKPQLDVLLRTPRDLVIVQCMREQQFDLVVVEISEV
jgi:hypothetical protein